jgi:hypothetical protein
MKEKIPEAAMAAASGMVDVRDQAVASELKSTSNWSNAPA